MTSRGSIARASFVRNFVGPAGATAPTAFSRQRRTDRPPACTDSRLFVGFRSPRRRRDPQIPDHAQRHLVIRKTDSIRIVTYRISYSMKHGQSTVTRIYVIFLAGVMSKGSPIDRSATSARRPWVGLPERRDDQRGRDRGSGCASCSTMRNQARHSGSVPACGRHTSTPNRERLRNDARTARLSQSRADTWAHPPSEPKPSPPVAPLVTSRHEPTSRG